MAWYNGIMSDTVTIDKAGRIVIPKAVRDRLRLDPGDSLTLDIDDSNITLSPVQEQAVLVKEHGMWVYAGQGFKNDSIPDLIDRTREERNRELSE